MTNAVAPLAAFATPSATAMAAVVAAHQAILAILQGAFPNSRRATSFASKFLWPDAPSLVPIFDRYTEKHARLHRLDYTAAIRPLRSVMVRDAASSVYFNHVLRYLATYQTLAAAGLPSNVSLTMKGIDHRYLLG